MHGYIELDKDYIMEVTEDNKDSIVIYIACVVTDDEPYELRFASSDERYKYCYLMDLYECNGIIDMGKETVWGFSVPYEIDVMYDIAYYDKIDF